MTRRHERASMFLSHVCCRQEPPRPLHANVVTRRKIAAKDPPLPVTHARRSHSDFVPKTAVIPHHPHAVTRRSVQVCCAYLVATTTPPAQAGRA